MQCPPWPRFEPPSPCADANHLYNKHTVVVQPVNPVAQTTMGGQTQTTGTSYELVCNVQQDGYEPNDRPPSSVTGILYTANLNGIKLNDEFTFEGRTYKVLGLRLYRDNVSFEPHHLEAQFVSLESLVQ